MSNKATVERRQTVRRAGFHVWHPVPLAVLLFTTHQILESIILSLVGRTWTQLCTWDCAWYQSIADSGYQASPNDGSGQANWAFFPVVPLLARLLSELTGLPTGSSLLIISKFFFLAGIFMFMKLAHSLDSQIDYLTAGLLVSFQPYAIYGNVGYSEAPFLFFTCLFFYLMKANKFFLAGSTASLLGIIRLAGIFTGASYVIAVASTWKRKPSQHRQALAGLMVIPVGILLFVAHLWQRTGDPLAFSSIQSAWGRELGNPISYMIDGLGHSHQQRMWVLASVIALGTCIFLWRKGFKEMAVFSLLATAVPLTTGLTSMARFLSWQAPLLFALALLCSRSQRWVLALPFFGLAQFILYEAWFAQRWWVT